MLKKTHSDGKRAAETDRAKRERGDEGFSLVTVAALGAVTMMWLFAIMQSVTPMFQRAAENRYATVMRSACEAGVDYAVSSLVDAMAAQTTSSFDDPAPGAPYTVVQMPSNLVGSSGVDVVVEVRNESPANSLTYLYDSITDPEAANNAVGNHNYYRYVKATATYAGLTKTISVILKPVHGGVTTSYETTTTSTPTTTTTVTAVPYFQWAAFGRALVSMTGNAYTDAYNSTQGPYGPTNKNTIYGAVGSNAAGTLSGNASVGGDLVVTSVPMGSSTSTVGSGSGNAVVHDQLILNGTSSGLNGQTTNTNPVPGDNVLAESRSLVDPNAIPVQVSQSNSQITVPDAPTAPASTESNPVYNVGAMSISGNGNIVIQNGAPAPSGSISVSGNNTVYIPPGNYIINSLSTSGNGAITIQSSVTTPVKLYVQGSTSGSNAVSISGNGIVNATTTPAMLQIWYDGTKNINLSGNGNLHGIIYAPKAPINVSGNGGLYGSLVGNTVTVSGNGGIHFDTALQSGNQAWNVDWQQTSTTTTNVVTSTTTTVNSVTVSGLKTVSWQEQ